MKQVIATSLYKNIKVELTDYFGDKVQFNCSLPEGCNGILYCFKSKKSARDCLGKNVELVEYDEIKIEN